eukprot:403355632
MNYKQNQSHEDNYTSSSIQHLDPRNLLITSKGKRTIQTAQQQKLKNQQDYIIKGSGTSKNGQSDYSNRKLTMFVAKRYSQANSRIVAVKYQGSKMSLVTVTQIWINRDRVQIINERSHQQIQIRPVSGLSIQNLSTNSQGARSNSHTLLKRNVIGQVDDYLTNTKDKNQTDSKGLSFNKQIRFNNLNQSQSSQLKNSMIQDQKIQEPIKSGFTQQSSIAVPHQHSYATSNSQNLNSQYLPITSQNKKLKQRIQFEKDQKIPQIQQIIQISPEKLDLEIQLIEDRIQKGQMRDSMKFQNHQQISQKIAQLRDQNALNKFEEIQQIWNSQKNEVLSRTNAQGQAHNSKSILDYSEQFRVKTEIKSLLDKGQTLTEKYGDARGWRMSLRYDDNNKNDQLEYSESSGPLHQCVSYKLKDDRKVPIEIIRKSKLVQQKMENRKALELSEAQNGNNVNRIIGIQNQKSSKKAYNFLLGQEHIASRQLNPQSMFNVSKEKQNNQLSNSQNFCFNNCEQKPQQNLEKPVLNKFGQINLSSQYTNLQSQMPKLSRPQTAMEYKSINGNPLIQSKFSSNPRKLRDLLPTDQINDQEIEGLGVVGQSVLVYEKNAALKLRQPLIESQDRQQIKALNNNQNNLFWIKQYDSNDQDYDEAIIQDYK